MQGHGAGGGGFGDSRWLRDTGIPESLRHRLYRWVEVDELGADGFWLWLRLVLPVLLSLASGPSTRRTTLSILKQSHVLHQRVVDARREHRRAATFLEQYVRDRTILERRLAALHSRLGEIESESRLEVFSGRARKLDRTDSTPTLRSAKRRSAGGRRPRDAQGQP